MMLECQKCISILWSLPRAIRTDGSGGVMPKPVASVRPMQAELSQQLERGQANRSTVTTLNTSGRSRWIPAEVWQRQGMSAQEMTLPLGMYSHCCVSIQRFIILLAVVKCKKMHSAQWLSVDCSWENLQKANVCIGYMINIIQSHGHLSHLCHVSIAFLCFWCI
jgi:hypothetical protein